MLADPSSLVEKLWRLKRLVDKGQCPGLQYVHLNTLLRSFDYREDVLSRVEIAGTEKLKSLAAEIRALDTGGSLMMAHTNAHARAHANTQVRKPAAADTAAPPGRLGRPIVWALAVVAVVVAGAAFTSCVVLEKNTIRVDADITTNTTWESGKTYRLEKIIYVKDADLTIESGVTVEGDGGAALIVTRNSKLFARGRSDSPIVFTSSRPEGKRQRGDWGGVVLLGNAPVNQPDATIEGLPEGEIRGLFGGQDPEDSCGIIEYVRIEFAGFEVYTDNELNGLTLGGCGSRTIIRNLQVHRSLDDGIELFGGTVDLKNIIITGAGDDSIDWDWGWTGRVQFAVIQQYSDAGDTAFEGDNNGKDHDASPRSAPTFYNVTLAGAGQSEKKHRGVVLREGSGGHFRNMIMDGYAIEALDLRDRASELIDRGELTFANNMLSFNGRFNEETGKNDDDFGFDESEWIRSREFLNVIKRESALDPRARVRTEPNFQPRFQAQQMTAAIPPESEFFDESASYLGAFKPGSQGWLEGWTAFPQD